jgi:hypothetical protein
MPKTIAREDHRVLLTIGYLEKYPNMGVLDAMKLGDFTKEERDDRAKMSLDLLPMEWEEDKHLKPSSSFHHV